MKNGKTNILVLNDRDDSRVCIALDAFVSNGAAIDYKEVVDIDAALGELSRGSYQAIMAKPYIGRAPGTSEDNGLVGEVSNILVDEIGVSARGGAVPLGICLAEKARESSIPFAFFADNYSGMVYSYVSHKRIFDEQRIHVDPVNDSYPKGDTEYVKKVVNTAYYRLVHDIVEERLGLKDKSVHLGDWEFVDFCRELKEIGEREFGLDNGGKLLLYGHCFNGPDMDSAFWTYGNMRKDK